MKHTHTPGPWADTGHDGKDNLIVESETGSVCAVWRVNGYGCQVADTRLISAAPDLLEALQMLMPQEPREADSYDRAMWENARAAIAKAMGKGEA